MPNMLSFFMDMAPCGHLCLHSPQPKQVWISATTRPSFSYLAPNGQIDMHKPHPLHFCGSVEAFSCPLCNAELIPRFNPSVP